MTLAEEIESIFLLHDYKWRIDGELRAPSSEDIETVIERAKTYLDEGGSIEIGRLIIQKMDQDKELYDVYVHVGSIGE